MHKHFSWFLTYEKVKPFIPVEKIKSLRVHGPEDELIFWILDAQALLANVLAGKSFSAADFGLPSAAGGSASQVYDGELPSIKKTKKSILSSSPKKGPNMHDTPPKPAVFE